MAYSPDLADMDYYGMSLTVMDYPRLDLDWILQIDD